MITSLGFYRPQNLSKFCKCGCGEFSPIAKRNDKRRGHLKDHPISYIHGHYKKFAEDNPSWKGNEVGYKGIHKFVNRLWPRNGKCEHCKRITNTQYASKDHKYSRHRKGYLELCFNCHVIYDNKMSLRKEII